MRQASYKDSAGRLWAVMLPERAPDSDAPLGVPLGPPSLASLGLPDEVEVRLHNQLFARCLFTMRDVRKRRLDVFAALQAAFAVDVQRIVELYSVGPGEVKLPSDDGAEPVQAGKVKQRGSSGRKGAE